jgi:hypothetical protein
MYPIKPSSSLLFPPCVHTATHSFPQLMNISLGSQSTVPPSAVPDLGLHIVTLDCLSLTLSSIWERERDVKKNMACLVRDIWVVVNPRN